jgi:hypothetical protein
MPTESKNLTDSCTPDSNSTNSPRASKLSTILILIMTLIWSLELVSSVFSVWYELVKHGDTREDAYFTYLDGGSATFDIIVDLPNLLITIRMALADTILVSTPSLGSRVKLHLNDGGHRFGDVGSSAIQIGTLLRFRWS